MGILPGTHRLLRLDGTLRLGETLCLLPRGPWRCGALTLSLLAFLSIGCGPAPDAQQRIDAQSVDSAAPDQQSGGQSGGQSADLPAEARAPRTLEEIQADGRLVALALPHQQSHFVRTRLEAGPMPREGGGADRFAGIDVDLMHRFAESMGVTLRILPVSEPSYGALIPDLFAGRGDLVASSLTITAERLERVAFSRPYFDVYPVVVAKRDSDLSSVEDLHEALGAVTGGSSLYDTLRRLGVDDTQIVTHDFTVEGFARVVEGDADYVLADSSSAAGYLAENPDLHVAFRLDQEEHYGFALMPESELLEPLDAFLAELEASGELREIIEEHLPAP